MQTYGDLHELFPSKKLVRKLFPPRTKPNAISIVMLREFVQNAVLTAIENNPDAKQPLTRSGKCLLHRFVDSENKVREFVFHSNTERHYATKQLAKELRKIATEGIDAEGFGTIVVEDGEVVFVPRPIVPTYGNILLFDPFFKPSI